MLRLFFWSFLFVSMTFKASLAQDTITLSTHLTPGNYNYLTTDAILKEAFKRNGLNLVLEPLPGKRALTEANQGRTDGEAHRIRNIIELKNLTNLVRVEEVQQTISDYAFSKGTISLQKGWESLGSYRVAIKSGSVLLTNMARKHAAEVFEAPDYETIFRMVRKGRVDIAIATPSSYRGIAGAKGALDVGLVRNKPALNKLEIYTFLHKKHANLAPKIAASLRQMKRDGSYEKIFNSLRDKEKNY